MKVAVTMCFLTVLVPVTVSLFYAAFFTLV